MSEKYLFCIKELFRGWDPMTLRVNCTLISYCQCNKRAPRILKYTAIKSIDEENFKKLIQWIFINVKPTWSYRVQDVQFSRSLKFKERNNFLPNFLTFLLWWLLCNDDSLPN